MKEENKRCVRCYLKEDPYHNVYLDDEGVCNLCKQFRQEKRMDWADLKKIFETKIEEKRGKGPEYDGLIMMSGGKDSAYLAYTLKKKYKLRVMGVINDIHYEYKETFLNAEKICKKLDIPLVVNDLGYERMTKFFHFLFTEKRLRDKGCGQICNYCGRLMINAAAEYAYKRRIPLLFSGHNPEQIWGMGQTYECDPRRKLRQEILNESIISSVMKARNIAEENGDGELIKMFPLELFPKDITGLFMYQHFPYEPTKMMEIISQKLNWEPIRSLSHTYIASGCRLANLWIHLSAMNNTSNYLDFELSEQVRNGVLKKEIIEKFYDEALDPSVEISSLLKELKLENLESLK